MLYVFRVGGLDCTMCAMSLEKKIMESVPEAVAVRVSHLQQRIEVSSKVNLEADKLLAIIRQCVSVCDGRVLVDQEFS